MKQSDIHVDGLYIRVVRGKQHSRCVVSIKKRKDGNPMNVDNPDDPHLYQGKYWNQQMVAFRKHYGDKGINEVTLPVFARWAEREHKSFCTREMYEGMVQPRNYASPACSGLPK